MQFKKNFILFIVAAVLSSGVAIPINPIGTDELSVTGNEIRGRTEFIEVAKRRHGDSAERGRSRAGVDPGSATSMPAGMETILEVGAEVDLGIVTSKHADTATILEAGAEVDLGNVTSKHAGMEMTLEVGAEVDPGSVISRPAGMETILEVGAEVDPGSVISRPAGMETILEVGAEVDLGNVISRPAGTATILGLAVGDEVVAAIEKYSENAFPSSFLLHSRFELVRFPTDNPPKIDEKKHIKD
ncbi:hypothetical protein VNI00_003213 [Paramarasmius palmivorus]|uniref:Uncharacterized protein n=1 Tax=Paramarasmius palmivorus TaxID=297713 RepID=A0AAW0DUI1_9AGAR